MSNHEQVFTDTLAIERQELDIQFCNVEDNTVSKRTKSAYLSYQAKFIKFLYKYHRNVFKNGFLLSYEEHFLDLFAHMELRQEAFERGDIGENSIRKTSADWTKMYLDFGKSGYNMHLKILRFVLRKSLQIWY